jgi:hypothetical protein
MKNKLLGILFGLMIILGAALLLMTRLHSQHRQLLNKADVLAAEGKFVEALSAYREVESHDTRKLLGIPRGFILENTGYFGSETRSYVRLRLAEMEFRAGETLLALYAPAQTASSAIPISNPVNKDHSEKPSLEEVIKHFNLAEDQYKQTQEQTQNPYWQFVANVNSARAITQIFLTKDFLEKQSQNPASLRQKLVFAVKSLQGALNALYTDQVRVPLTDERNAVLLLETLTRFQQTPEIEERERKQIEGLIKDAMTLPELQPLGDMLKKGSAEDNSTPPEGNPMKDFLLERSQNPSNSSEQANRPPESAGPKAGPGSADAGSEGQMH